MDQTDANLIEVVREELVRLGVQGNEDQSDVKKSLFQQNGAKILGFTTTNIMNKIGSFSDSPKSDKNGSGSQFQHEMQKTPKHDNKVRRVTSKSPFSTKSRMERKSGRKKREQIASSGFDETKNHVFGRDLDSMQLCSTYLQDGTLVSIPEFVIDARNLIQKNITIEGIFRKAGSSQRQNEIKKLLNSGKSLPSTVHPIDAACLLKQFMRSLPAPLLPHHVHFLMTKCLELPSEEQKEALSLCSLLLTKPHLDLLAYILELLSCVASPSNGNLMDSHNLAIVLAPNLLPAPRDGSAKKGDWRNDDNLLSSTIDVIQRLIEGANGMCRLSPKLAVAVQNREKSQSMENLCDVPANGAGFFKKKRRSASIHRFVNGLRRVVQGGNILGSSQTPTVSAIPQSAVTTTPPIPQDTPNTVSMEPDVDLKPQESSSKRKSDTFEIVHDRAAEPLSVTCIGELERPIKKPKIELKSTRAENGKVAQEMDQKKPFLYPKAKHAKIAKSAVSVNVNNNATVQRRYSLREKSIQSPVIRTSSARNSFERRKSYGPSSANVTPKRVCSKRTLNTLQTKSSSPSPYTKKCFGSTQSPYPDTRKPKRLITPKTPQRTFIVQSPKSDDMRPVGTEHNILGPRGMPDGAETNIRDSVVPKPPLKSVNSDPVRELERQYDDIKAVVKTAEEKVDFDNLQALKKTFFSMHSSPEFSNMSCSQLINDAYEKMRLETKDLGSSPPGSLSKRLGRELKIRSRRSNEHRVVRSPSERRISTIRRRSKELEQNGKTSQQLGDVGNAKGFTPKLKGTLLMQSPLPSLKRGKPNSIKSGLPIVVKPAEDSARTDAPQNRNITPGKIVTISKRRLSSRNSASSIEGLADSLHEISVSAAFSGPITRRRSSVTSTVSNPLPTFDLGSAENSFETSFKSLSNVENKYSQGSDSENKDLASYSRGCTVLLSSSGKDLSAMGESEWISASKFMNEFQEEKKYVPTVEPQGNRPSIAALKKQKKVTANVQLFSQLQSHEGLITPVPSSSFRRSTRHRRTPFSHTPLRAVNSDCLSSRSNMTAQPPRIPLEQRRFSRSKLHSKGEQSPQVAVVTPMKENKFSNNPDSVHSTPKIMDRENVSRLKRTHTFIVPSGLTPLLPPRPFKPSHLTTPKMVETPPRLPPRSAGSSSRKLVPVRSIR